MMRTTSCLLVLLLVPTAPRVYAMTFTVDSTNDAVDAAPGDGTCATAGAACTLRAAIQEANALAGDDTVDVPAGTYTLSIPAGSEGTAALDASVGDLDITQNLTITGTGAATTIVDGGGATRVFHEAGAVTFTISGLTVRNGADQAGGGIFAQGSLTLHDVVVTASTATGSGGGIQGGTALTLDHATVSGNTSTGQGAGIFGGTPVVVDHSTISGNSTPDQGGGIFSDGPLTITNSTLSGNGSGDQGGGVFIENGALTVVNSTISGNTCTGQGGGLFNNPPFASTNTVRLRNTTITANTASEGGGVFTFDPGVITVRNTLLAANTSTGGSSPDAGGMLGSEGFNLIGSTDGATVVGITTGNLVGVAANLGLLADNGGPTQTHLLLAGNPAIDGGDPAGCVDGQGSVLTTDQRDDPRPQGPRCDIGSVEGTASTGTTTTTTLPQASCDGVPPGATFASIDCRLAALLAQLTASTDLGPQATRLRKQITKGKQRKEDAEAACRQPNVRRTKSLLKKATRKLIQFDHALGSHQAKKSIPDDLREQLRRAGDGILLDLRSLKRVVRCPDDAAAA